MSERATVWWSLTDLAIPREVRTLAPHGRRAAGSARRAARARPRHRAPSQWWPEEAGEGSEIVMVDELLARHQRQLFRYWLVRYRREHASHARRVTVVPRPRTAHDERGGGSCPALRALPLGSAQLLAAQSPDRAPSGFGLCRRNPVRPHPPAPGDGASLDASRHDPELQHVSSDPGASGSRFPPRPQLAASQPPHTRRETPAPVSPHRPGHACGAAGRCLTAPQAITTKGHHD